MRKRTVVLVLAMVFSLSIVGCGNDSEPKREEVQAEKQEVEQEETKADAEVEQEEVEEETEQKEETSNTIAENDVLVITGEEGRYSEYDLQAFEEVSEFGEEKSFNEDAPVYSEEGTQVGYIKKGSTIFIDESLNLRWYRFKNPIEGTEYDNLYVLQDYFSDAQNLGSEDTDEVIDDPKTAYVVFDLELQNNFEKDGRKKYDGDGIQINIPMLNTQKWAEEKVGQFKEKGITTYYMEGSDGENGNLRIDIWMFDENGILTTEEMQEIFADGEENDRVNKDDPMFAYSIFADVIRSGGYGTDWQLAEEGDGLMVNVPNENTKEWSEEKLKLIKEKSVTSLNFEGYGWTDDGSNVMIWLKTDNGLLTVVELQEIFE